MSEQPYKTNVEDIPLEEGLSPQEGWFEVRVQFFIDSTRAAAA
jgi:hypothetical protein